MPPFPNPFYFLLPVDPFAIPMFYISESISYYYILFVHTCSRFFYPLVAPYSFLFHFVEHLGAPFLSSYFLSLPLFSKSFHCHPWVATLILCLFHFSFAFVSFSFPSLLSLSFSFSQLLFCAPFSFFFSLFFPFYFHLRPSFFGAPLRLPGGTCPLCPIGYATENVSIISDSKLKKGKPICPHIPVTRFCGCPLKPSLHAAHPNLHTLALPVSNMFHRSG